MAKRQKTTAFSFQGFDINHYRTTDAYTRAVGNLFDRATNDIAAGVAKLNVDPDKPFQFGDYPSAQATLKRVVSKLAKNMTAVVAEGSRKQWLFACQKNDEFVNSIIDTSKVSKARLNKMQDRNLDAMKTFQGRKVDGMNLSERVWKYTQQFKEQIECGLDVGLGEGRSAQELSRDLRQNLNDPNRLFRRVRDKRGNLQLSKNAQAFHPGRGVYRSSCKNAMRLTRSEINMAYREADWLRWQQLDFVIGFEVHRTNHEPQCKCSLCERLKGKYPKSFKFKGWHPQCMCYVTPILTTDEEFDAQELSDLKSALHGTPYKKLAVKQPEFNGLKSLEEWAKENQDLQGKWGSTPYFIKDNFKGGLLGNGLRVISKETPKIDPIQQQLDQLQPSIAAIKQMANEWGLNTYIVDDALAKRNPQGVINAISEIRNRVNTAMNELKLFVTDAAETIKQAKQANVDAMDMVNALSEINADKRDWVMSKVAYKQVLADLKAKILAKSNGLSKITAPEWSYKPDSPKLSPRQRLENLLDNLEHYHGTSISASGYIAQSRQLIADGATDRVLEYKFETLKKWKNIMMGEAKPCYQSINHLSELRSIKISDIPNEWRKAYNEAINTINQNDFTKNGYKDVYSNIEKAYNIYKLSKSDIVRKTGIDKISPNMPYNILTEYVKKIPGMMDCLPSKAFFDSLNEFVPLVSLKSGAHFSPTYKYVNISLSDSDNINRMSKSAWYRKGLFYHEFGHAFDHQIKLKKDSDLILTYKNWQADILKDNGVSLENFVKNKISKFNQEFEKKRDEIYKERSNLQNQGKNDESKRLWADFLKEADLHEAKAMEFNEQLGAFTDCLQAAVKGHRFISPRGHDVKYFSEDKQLDEFIAHCSENYWGNNPIFKEIAPQLYEQMQNIIKKKMAKL